MLLLPVLLILAAAFLATSLSFGGDSNDLTGASVNSVTLSRCAWNDVASSWADSIGINGEFTRTRYCPLDKPVIVSGGCENGKSDAHSYMSKPEFARVNGAQGWTCGQKDNNNNSKTIEVDALCCRI